MVFVTQLKSEIFLSCKKAGLEFFIKSYEKIKEHNHIDDRNEEGKTNEEDQAKMEKNNGQDKLKEGYSMVSCGQLLKIKISHSDLKNLFRCVYTSWVTRQQQKTASILIPYVTAPTDNRNTQKGSDGEQ